MMGSRKGNNRKPKQPKARIELITPAKATKLLADARKANVPMRKTARSRVATYARDMREGRFHLAEALMLNHRGKMVNGFHRCEACVLAQVGFHTWVHDYTDCPEAMVKDALWAIDGGRNRLPRDKLEMAGMVEHADAQLVAAAANFIWRHRNFTLAERSQHPSHQAVRDIVDDAMPKLAESVAKAREAKHIYPRTAELAALHFIFSEQDVELADLFVDALGTGERLTAGDPVYLLRERLIKDKALRHGRKMNSHERMAITAKSWNWTHNGRPNGKPQRLSWRSKGKRPEPFPAIA